MYEDVPAPKGWVTAALREDLMAKVDDFVKTNSDGYHSRGEVIAAAVREFLQRHGPQPPI